MHHFCPPRAALGLPYVQDVKESHDILHELTTIDMMVSTMMATCNSLYFIKIFIWNLGFWNYLRHIAQSNEHGILYCRKIIPGLGYLRYWSRKSTRQTFLRYHYHDSSLMLLLQDGLVLFKAPDHCLSWSQILTLYDSVIRWKLFHLMRFSHCHFLECPNWNKVLIVKIKGTDRCLSPYHRGRKFRYLGETHPLGPVTSNCDS